MLSRANLRIAVIALAVITGVIHLFLGATSLNNVSDPEMQTMGIPLAYLWLLNGLGYFGLLAAIFLNVPFFSQRRGLAHYLLMAFSAVTIAAYFAVQGLTDFGAMAIITKVDELLLIVAAYFHMRSS